MQPVRRVEIPKRDGAGVRKLGIPCVLDRFVQQAVLQVLQKRWDPTFSEHSHGFRPGRSARQAVHEAQQYIAEGYRWVVDLDLEKFFDRVNHDRLMAAVAERVADKRMLKLIRAFLEAGVMEDGLVSPVDEGTPQGGPLSPLLSNLVLDELDRELERRGLRTLCRRLQHLRGQRTSGTASDGEGYALHHAPTQAQGESGEERRGSTGAKKVSRIQLHRRTEPRRRIAPKAIARFKERIREQTRRTRGISLTQMVTQIATYLRGWLGYFDDCQTPSVLQTLESWLRRRLRSVVWKQWKRGRTRFRELRKRNVSKDLAARTAGSPHGPWRIANSPALAIALPNAYFAKLGLPPMVVRF
jgi:RNA-directed DNA polymerase